MRFIPAHRSDCMKVRLRPAGRESRAQPTANLIFMAPPALRARPSTEATNNQYTALLKRAIALREGGGAGA